MKINSSISTKTVRLLSHLLTFLLTIFTYSFSKAQDSLVIKDVKGTYYIRVSAAQVLSVPLCNPSTATAVLSGSDDFKRMCRYAGVFRITRPFTGLEPSGLGDTLGRYFRLDFSDTSLQLKFKDSLLTLPYMEIVEGLPVMKNFGTFTFPNDKFAAKQWHMDKVKGLEAQDYSTGSGVIVAVVDDAFDINHEDLKESYYVNTAELNGTAGVDDDGNGYVDDIKGWDASDADNDPNNYGTTQFTMKYHGTMVTGVIAAAPNNLKGVAGIAPDVKIIPIKISSDSFAGNPLTHPLEGLMYAIQSPAKIINLSWGGEMFEGQALSSVLHLLIQMAYFNGKLIVVAAGNGYTPAGVVPNCIDVGRGKASYQGWISTDSIRTYPAAFNEVFSVGATASNDQKTCFSDYGTMSYVDIMAPGEGIYTTFPFNEYFPSDGTSFAAPLTAGICALVWSINPLYTKIGVTGQVITTANTIREVNHNIAGKIGAGRVNALDAVLNKTVRAYFKVEGQQTGCDSSTFRFLADSFAGYTYVWSYNDGSYPVTGSPSQYKTFYIPLSQPDYLFDVTLNIKNSLGVVVSTYTRPKYIMESKCSNNLINNKQNMWMFAQNCVVDFNSGLAKQKAYTSSLAKTPNLGNFTILNKSTTNVLKYFAATDLDPNSSNYTESIWFKDTYYDTFNMAFIDYYGRKGIDPIKQFRMYVPAYRNLQGEFFRIDSKRTIYISNYDTNFQALNVGLRYAIIRDSIWNGSYPYIYMKSLQYGIPVSGPVIADKTSDGCMKVDHGICFIPKCDGQVWMIVKGASGIFQDSLLLYLINLSPTTFSITLQDQVTCPHIFSADVIRANRYGTQIVLASERDSSIIVFDFKRSTGKLTLRHHFGLDYRYKLAPVFNKEGNILYLIDWEGLKQINLNYKHPREHVVTVYTDYYLKNRTNFYFVDYFSYPKNPMYAIQLGPDGRVYSNFPSDMFPNNRLGIVAQPDKFFYNTYAGTYQNYLPTGLKFNNYTSPATPVSSYQGITDYQHASECNSLPTKLFATFEQCDVVRLYSNSCTPLKKWKYYDSVTHITHWRYADEYLVYLDSFPATGVVMTMIDGADTLHRLLQQPVLPPSSLIASATSTCSREVPVNYKFSHSILNQTDIFVKDWSVEGGEIFRYLGDSSVDVMWNGDGVVGKLQSIIMHPLNGCKDTILFTIQKKPPIKIIGAIGLPPYRLDSAFIEYDSIFYLRTSDTGYRPVYTTYKWFKDGVKLNFSDTTQRILVIEPGIYHLVANGPCGTDTSNKMVVVVKCRSTPNHSNWTTSGTYTGQTLTLDGKIDIGLGSKLVFQNCTLFMTACSYFDVFTHLTSDTLMFINTKIIGCDDWEGIRVRGPGLMPRTPLNCGFLSLNDCSIDRALIGVSVEDGGEVILNNNRFTNNEMHIAFNDYSFSSNALIFGNSFGRLRPGTIGCSHPLSSLLTSKKTNPWVYFQKVKDITFGSNSFEGSNVYSIGNISNIEAQGVTNLDMQNNEFYSETDFGIHIWNSSNSDLSANLFNDQSRYTPNTQTGLGVTKTGLRAKSCAGLAVNNNNTFWCCHNGIEWYDSLSRATSTISENTFKGCNNGVVFAQQVNPLTNFSGSFNTNTSYNIQANIRCNLFELDSLAIVGSGLLMPQGTQPIGVRNKFVNNINWDMAFQDSIGYWSHPKTTQYRPDSSSTLLKNPVTINNVANKVFKYRYGTSSSTCSNGLFVAKNNTPLVSNKGTIFVFPNPISQSSINIELSDTGQANCSLHNVLGQLLALSILQEQENILNFDYPPGIYFLRVRQGLTLKHFKLIKQ